MPSYKSDLVSFDGQIIEHTDKAWLFLPDEFKDGEAVWIPKSEAEWTPSRDDEFVGEMEMPTWLAEKKGLA